MQVGAFYSSFSVVFLYPPSDIVWLVLKRMFVPVFLQGFRSGPQKLDSGLDIISA